MKKIYNTISDKVLKSNPFLWIIGWHKFLPIIILLMIAAIILGFLIPTKVYTYSPQFLYETSTFLGFLAFVVFVLFVIRQIKFNSFRIHHKIPYKKSITTYFYFVFFILFLVILPFISVETYNYRVLKEVNTFTKNFKEDSKTLNDNLFFFYSEDDSYYLYDDNGNRTSKQNVEYYDNYLIINSRENTFTYEISKEYPLKITKTEALQRIADFLEVANRFNINVSETNPTIIYNKRKHFKARGFHNLLTLGSYKNPRTIYSKYSSFINHYRYNSSFDLHDKEVIYAFLFIAMITALFLWIVISIPIADFGYTILAGTLILIFVGVMSALLSIASNTEDLIIWFMYLCILIIFLLAFTSKENTLVSRIMTVLSQLLIPILVLLFYIDYTNDLPYEAKNHVRDFIPFIILLTIVSTVFLYKYIYRSSRMLPR